MFNIHNLCLKELRNLELNVGDYIWISSDPFEDFDVDCYIPVLRIEQNRLVDSLGRDRTFYYTGEEVECVKLDMTSEMFDFFNSGGRYRDDNNSLELFERYCKLGDFILFSLDNYELDAVSYGIYVGHNEIFNGTIVLKESLGYYYKLDSLTDFEKMYCDGLYRNYQHYSTKNNLEFPKVITTGDTYFLDNGSLEAHICVGRKNDKIIFFNLLDEEDYILDYLNSFLSGTLHTIDLLDYMLNVDRERIFKYKKYGYSPKKYKYLGKFKLIEDGLSIFDVYKLSGELEKLRMMIYDNNKDDKYIEIQNITEKRKEKEAKYRRGMTLKVNELQSKLLEEYDLNKITEIQNTLADLREQERIWNIESYNNYIKLKSEIEDKYKKNLSKDLERFDENLKKFLTLIKNRIINISDFDVLDDDFKRRVIKYFNH